MTSLASKTTDASATSPATPTGAAAVRPPSSGAIAWRAMTSLWGRELIRFKRQRYRIVGALATPLIFWWFLGSGLDRAFVGARVGEAAGGVAGVEGYRVYFFPGIAVLILLFSAVFSTMSVIEDRRSGFLQAVRVSPAPSWAVMLGLVGGGAMLAWAQAMVCLFAWPLVGPWPGFGAMTLAAGVLAVMAVGMSALGLALAWGSASAASFHAMLNLVLMPIWFLCGAVFPIDRAPGWMQALMYANPLTYGYEAFASCLVGAAPRIAVPFVACLVGAALASGLALAWAHRVVSRA
jgi:ABC-2 type transport system permease protein